MQETETDKIIRSHFASNIFFRTLFEKSTDAKVIIDPVSAEIILFNELAYEQLGYTKAEFRKLSLADIDVYENIQAVKDHIARILAVNEEAYSTKHKTKDGRILDVEVLAKVVELANNKFILCNWTDVTELYESIREKEELIKELKDSMEEIKKLREILPICTYCKRISDKNGQWETMEECLSKKTKYDFSHGICPDCMKSKFPDYADKDPTKA
ncbi:MAG TPA: hypothetical protein DCZ94_13235 [Lentisphaeria bacterium]|nr:MAG: hypothetical protein A2X48_15245 [Lentisphaerae bacterium GWF2_49_21]HBC87911.1 hypothetical protein [Lentisphaeria bacterium]